MFLAALQACLTHRASSKAAALAFYTLFSLAPILVLALTGARYLFGAQAAQGEVLARLRQLLGPAGAGTVQGLLATARVPEMGRAATLLAFLMLGFGATSVFAELKDSLDEIWKVQAPVPTGMLALLRTRVLAFGLVLALSGLLLVALGLDLALGFVARYWGEVWSSSWWIFSGLSSLGTFAILACLFAVIYKMLPEVVLPWRDAAFGALVTAVLFSLGKAAIGAYLSTLGHSGALGPAAAGRGAPGFGAAGSVAALLAWVYYSAQTFFLGAEFTRIFARTCGGLRPGAGNEPPT
jgi:membrane protein